MEIRNSVSLYSHTQLNPGKTDSLNNFFQKILLPDPLNRILTDSQLICLLLKRPVEHEMSRKYKSASMKTETLFLFLFYTFICLVYNEQNYPSK